MEIVTPKRLSARLRAAAPLDGDAVGVVEDVEVAVDMDVVAEPELLPEPDPWLLDPSVPP